MKPKKITSTPKKPADKIVSYLIPRDILIAEMIEKYPEVTDYLVEEYGFYCVSCFISGWEKLEDGARVHGIIDADFETMLTNLNKIAAGEQKYESKI